MKIKSKEITDVLTTLESLGNIATTSSIRKKMLKTGKNPKNLRTILRMLHKQKIIQTDRPFFPESLELRWEFLGNKETTQSN